MLSQTFMLVMIGVLEVETRLTCYLTHDVEMCIDVNGFGVAAATKMKSARCFMSFAFSLKLRWMTLLW